MSASTDPLRTDIGVHDDPARHRFVITVDGEIAGVVLYAVTSGTITLRHTEIDDRFAGRGLGGRLVRSALDEARGRG